LKLTLLGAFLAGLLLSPKLWLAERAYPFCPISSFLPPIPHPLDYLWYAAVLSLLCVALVLRRPARSLWLFIVLLTLLCLWDQMRWQPWVYQYLIMTATLAICFPSAADKPGNTEAALDSCRLILAATYFWSGLHKLNAAFPNEGFAFLLAGILPPLPKDAYLAGGLAAALFETAIGLGLLTRRLRSAAVIGAVAMHAFVLVCIGPWALDYNPIIWPWNIAMAGFVIILFWRTDFSWQTIVGPHGRAWHAFVIVLFGIMPFFNFLGLWDAYLSANLYSGDIRYGEVYVRKAVLERLSAEVQPHVRKVSDDAYRLDIINWSLAELNVPPNPEWRVYRAIAQQLCPLADRPDQLYLVIYERPNRWSGQRQVTKYDCEELK
jgi:hypothetical protein